MTKTETKCAFPKCRNVGRKEYDLVAEEDGELLAEYIGQHYICKKHLMETLEKALGGTDEEWQLRTENGTLVTDGVVADGDQHQG